MERVPNLKRRQDPDRRGNAIPFASPGDRKIQDLGRKTRSEGPGESCNSMMDPTYRNVEKIAGAKKHMAGHANEKEWIRHAMQGDDDAFARVVEAYQVPVYNLCYRMVGEPMEAEDAAQETFLKAYRGLKRYDPERSFTTWLLSIASHHCIDQLRRKRILTLSFDDLLPRQEKPDVAPGPEAVMVNAESQEAVRELLQHLGWKDRAAVVMRYWYEMSYEEISQSLSISVSAVKSRLHRARRKMSIRRIEQETRVIVPRGRRDEASAL